MGPVVHQLESAYAGRATIRRFELDQLKANSPELPVVQRLAELAHLEVTPTFLVFTADGHVLSKHEGTTSYLTLKGDLDRAIEQGKGTPPAGAGSR